MKKLLYGALVFLIFADCTGKTTQSPPPEATEETAQVEKSWYEGEKPFVFNAEEEYPETGIRLSELADISYIPLGINENTILRLQGTCEGNIYLLTHNRIYLNEEQSVIYIFKRDGTPLKKIDRQGNGPEEYTYISSYVVDTLHQEIFVQDVHKKRSLVYDLEGNFKRTFPNKAKEIAQLNDSLLVNYFQYNPKGPRYSVIRKSDGSQIAACPIRFNVKLPNDALGRLAYGSLIKSPNGVFLSNLGNDTVFEIRKEMQILPRIIDKSNYGTNFAQAHPTIETGRYLLFYILRCHSYKPAVKQNFYAYDKKEKQIYKMRDYPDNDYWTLLDDYPHIQNWETTQDFQTGVRSRLVQSLLDAKGKHGDAQINQLVPTLDEDANPILQVMTFHNVTKF